MFSKYVFTMNIYICGPIYICYTFQYIYILMYIHMYTFVVFVIFEMDCRQGWPMGRGPAEYHLAQRVVAGLHIQVAELRSLCRH